MTSFQISITPSRRAAARFILDVRRKLQKALADENNKSKLTQSDIARTIGVHRSVINREMKGYKDMTLGRLAELAFAMERVPRFDLIDAAEEFGANVPVTQSTQPGTLALNPTIHAAPAEKTVSGTQKIDVKEKYSLVAA